MQRTFAVKHENSTEQLEVQQFQILAWPEGENPSSLPGLLEVLEDPEIQQPLLVHSRTGTGRTGVIICIHRVLKCISAGSKPDLPGVVRHMRKQRVGMIQNFEQYKTCISAVLRYLQHVTGFTTMSIEDGAAASSSLPQLDIIHPRTHTVAAHPLVTNVAKQKVARTYSDPTLNESPQAKRRMFLQDMIPPPPKHPPPYTDDDAARAPKTPQVPVSPPPPLTPPENDELKSTSGAQGSSISPMQFKEPSTTTHSTFTNDSNDTGSSLLQRQTMRASQHDDTTVTESHDQLHQETTKQQHVPPQETEENELFAKTFGSTKSLTNTTTATTTTTATATTTTTTTVTTTEVKPVEEAPKSTTKVASEMKESHQQQQQEQKTQETPETPLESSTVTGPTVDNEDPVKQVGKDTPPLTQTATKPFNEQHATKKTSVRETAKKFGGETKPFTNVPKVKSSIGELAKVFGGTVTQSTSESKPFNKTQNVSETTKRFGSTKQPKTDVPTKPQPIATMEDQTLTFTFDNIDGEFTEMKLNRSVGSLQQTKSEGSTQPHTTVKTDVPTSTSSSLPSKQETNDSRDFHPVKKPSKQPEPQQPPGSQIKKLDMSKYAMFGKSIHH